MRQTPHAVPAGDEDPALDHADEWAAVGGDRSGPTQTSLRRSQSTPSSSGDADSTMARTRAATGGASGSRNSMVPATRNAPWYGVHATRASGR